jgi:hypothetical protein
VIAAQPHTDDRGSTLLLAHCAAFGEGRPPAAERLVQQVGAELARLLMFALAGDQGRRGSSSP